MYNFHIRDMADAIGKKLKLNPDDSEAVYDAIAAYWVDKIAITWGIEDVRELRPKISDEDAITVLQHVLDCSSAEVGVTWDIIDSACYALFPDAETADYTDTEDDEDGSVETAPGDAAET